MHMVLSPAQSHNSQLELACTRLVQWYLSLLALSDLIIRKKLNVRAAGALRELWKTVVFHKGC